MTAAVEQQIALDEEYVRFEEDGRALVYGVRVGEHFVRLISYKHGRSRRDRAECSCGRSGCQHGIAAWRYMAEVWSE